MLYNRCTGIYKFGNNTYPRRIRHRSNLGHIFGGKKCILWAGKCGIYMMYSGLSLFLGLCIVVSLIHGRITVTTSLHHDVVTMLHDNDSGS